MVAGQLETGKTTVFQCPHQQIEGGDGIQYQQHGAVIKILRNNQCKDQGLARGLCLPTQVELLMLAEVTRVKSLANGLPHLRAP